MLDFPLSKLVDVFSCMCLLMNFLRKLVILLIKFSFTVLSKEIALSEILNNLEVTCTLTIFGKCGTLAHVP